MFYINVLIYEKIIFKDVCKDTCFLDSFNESSFTIIIDIENLTLQLNEIIYYLLPKIEKHKLRINFDKNTALPLISVYKDKNLVVSSENNQLELESGLYDIDITPKNKSIERIILHGIELKSDVEKDILFDEIEKNISLGEVEIKKKYAIDSSLIDNATLTTTAYGNTLFKCKDWNYELEVCLGDWQKIKNLQIGEEYNITVSKEDPAFVEGNTKVIVTPSLKSNKKDFKLDEDIELDFEYLAKQELMEHDKWKEEYEVFEETTNKTKNELGLLNKKIVKKENQTKKWIADKETIETFVYDSEGALTTIEPEIEELREGKFDIKLTKQRAFRAGKYTLKLELVKDGITYTQEQDFTWGVLAINLNKSTYLENEDAFISLGVLDDRGKIICDADITLEITSPTNQKTMLTTENLDIVKHAECGFLGVTQMPDYYTYYKVNSIGTYIMNLTAVTYNGVRNIVDYIIVSEHIDFDISRKSATRIYPLVPYVMNISIIANKNYDGAINEYVPAGFDISNVEIYEVTQEEVTLLSAKDAGTGNKVLESLSEISLLAIKNIDNKNINSNQNYKPSSLINSEVEYIYT